MKPDVMLRREEKDLMRLHPDPAGTGNKLGYPMSESFNKDEYLADLERRQNLVTADDGWITIHGPFEYEIALSRCSTAVAILQWVCHLSQKTWVTTEVIERFVAVASAKAGLDIDSVPA